MKHLISFIKQIFPPKKKLVLQGLGYGFLLTAILWYPIPGLLERMNLPTWVVYLLMLILLLVLLGAILSGKLTAKPELIGWTSMGMILSGIVFTVLFPGEHVGAILSGCCVLIISFFVCGKQGKPH